MRVRLLREAESELQRAANWYEKQVAGLGTSLMDAVTVALLMIEQAPERHPRPPQLKSRRNIRRVVLRKFPYSIIYELRTTEALIVAIAHAKRRFGYWQRRRG